MSDRLPRVKWPHTYPICTLFGIVCALLLTAGSAYLQYRWMPPLGRYYLPAFVKTAVLPVRQTVQMIEVHSPAYEAGYVMAVDPWMVTRRERTKTVFSLSDEAVRLGFTQPRFFEARNVNPQKVHFFLVGSIYHGSLAATFRPTIIVLALALGTGILLGAWLDGKHQEEARRGIQIRGPKMMTPRRAKKYLKGNGIALLLEPNSR